MRSTDRIGRVHGRTLAVAGLAAVLVVAGCATSQNLPREGGLHPRLTQTTYIEEGNLMSIAVDAQAASHREKQPFIPLAVAVGNRTMDRLTINRESFTLVDEEGNRYPLATVAEARKLGNLATADYRISEQFFESISTNYMNYRLQNGTFFPLLTGSTTTGGRGTVVEKVEMTDQMWFVDMLYFPHPKGDIMGKRFELWLSAPELPEPVFVKFRIGK